MLEAAHLGKKYTARWAVKPLDFRLRPGMHALLGPNGAGKTTLMRLLAGMLRPSTGAALLNGEPVLRGAAMRRRIGYVPQTVHMYPSLTAREWLTHAARLKGVTARELRASVERMLQSVNLADVADRPARTYSGGMIKRLGIAQALVGEPELIIADEPTAGLDPEERIQLRNLLAETALTRPVLLSTHILSDIRESCSHVLVLKDGELAYHGALPGLARFGDGRIWTWEAAEGEWRTAQGMELLSAHRSSEGFVCRALAPAPPNRYAIQAEPTPEEGYIALLASASAPIGKRERAEWG